MAKKAPGKHYREGLTLIQFIGMFPDSKAAEDWFVKARWPESVHCPHCGSLNVQQGASHKTMPFRCRERECRKRFSVKTGTVMEASNLDCQKWAIALYLCLTNLKGVSSMKAHRELGITQKTAWFMIHRIRKALETDGGLFAGPVEVDETYIGGKEKNKHKKLRKGRGSVGKTAVVGARDRATNKIAAKDTKGHTLKGFIRSQTASGAAIHTDEHRAYRGLDNHESVCHSVGEYVRGQAHTNGIKSFWSMLKRGYHGIHHHMSAKHLDRYVTEFAGRHNMREMGTVDQMEAMVTGFVGKRLRYQDLIA